jgi:tetratricopeptide (TPR) repeat protein
MAKIGRNDPCPCGSGNKYKRCCLARHEADARLVAAVARELAAAEAEIADELTTASNAVVDLIDAGELDAAEQAAHDLLARFPDVHDGYDRLGMVCEARGDHRQAADYYRKAIDVIRQHPDDYDPDFAATFQSLVDRLDPPAAT